MADWHISSEWQKARKYAKTILDPICQHCTKELQGDDWTIDHIIPAGSGGTPNHDINNLQSLCRSCNSKKQDREYKRIPWTNTRWN